MIFNAEDAKSDGREERGIMGHYINDLSHAAIGAAIEVHRELGPGLLESAYEGSLSRELSLRGIPHVNQSVIPLIYKGHQIESGFRIDLLIEDRLVVELKAIEALLPIHSAQVLTYLRLGNYPLGL